MRREKGVSFGVGIVGRRSDLCRNFYFRQGRLEVVVRRPAALEHGSETAGCGEDK